MSSRVLISGLCLGAIALACGPRSHNEASTPLKNATQLASASAPLIQQGATRARGAAKTALQGQLYVHAEPAAVRFAFHVANPGRKRVEITFPSGQTYDFVVIDSIGREMWRWSAGRMFTQALRNKVLAGGDAFDVEETWATASLAPGRYTARAVLKSQNFPVAEQTDFTIQGATIASR